MSFASLKTLVRSLRKQPQKEFGENPASAYRESLRQLYAEMDPRSEKSVEEFGKNLLSYNDETRIKAERVFQLLFEEDLANQKRKLQNQKDQEQKNREEAYRKLEEKRQKQREKEEKNREEEMRNQEKNREAQLLKEKEEEALLKKEEEERMTQNTIEKFQSLRERIQKKSRGLSDSTLASNPGSPGLNASKPTTPPRKPTENWGVFGPPEFGGGHPTKSKRRKGHKSRRSRGKNCPKGRRTTRAHKRRT